MLVIIYFIICGVGVTNQDYEKQQVVRQECVLRLLIEEAHWFPQESPTTAIATTSKEVGSYD